MSRRLIERLATTVLFTGAQLWAITVVLVHLHASGALAAAIALAMAGGLVAVHDAWRDVRAARTTEPELVKS
jgi:D-alanyl-D-alanine dipeptidase